MAYPSQGTPMNPTFTSSYKFLHLNVGRTCDVFVTNRIWQRDKSIMFTWVCFIWFKHQSFREILSLSGFEEAGRHAVSFLQRDLPGKEIGASLGQLSARKGGLVLQATWNWMQRTDEWVKRQIFPHLSLRWHCSPGWHLDYILAEHLAKLCGFLITQKF